MLKLFVKDNISGTVHEYGTIPEWDLEHGVEPYIDIAGEYYTKPMTNADRIRAMSDEALCERLYHVWRNEADKGNDIAINWCDPECCSSEECDPDKHKACILRWLQRPAEGCR